MSRKDIPMLRSKYAMRRATNRGVQPLKTWSKSLGLLLIGIIVYIDGIDILFSQGFVDVINMLHRRMKDNPRMWRHIYKALMPTVLR